MSSRGEGKGTQILWKKIKTKKRRVGKNIKLEGTLYNPEKFVKDDRKFLLVWAVASCRNDKKLIKIKKISVAGHHTRC